LFLVGRSCIPTHNTSLLRLLIQGYPGPVIALDTKGSPELADTV
jgi:hypothetical protein